MKHPSTFCLCISLLIFAALACKNTDRDDQPHIYQPESVTTPANSTDASGSDGSATNTDSKTVSGGVLNDKATNLVKPVYPPAAKAVRASGEVVVQVTVDEKGDVVSASAVSGHPLLRASATQAARASKFSPTILGGKAVKVTGTVTYNFTPE